MGYKELRNLGLGAAFTIIAVHEPINSYAQDDRQNNDMGCNSVDYNRISGYKSQFASISSDNELQIAAVKANGELVVVVFKNPPEKKVHSPVWSGDGKLLMVEVDGKPGTVGEFDSGDLIICDPNSGEYIPVDYSYGPESQGFIRPLFVTEDKFAAIEVVGSSRSPEYQLVIFDITNDTRNAVATPSVIFTFPGNGPKLNPRGGFYGVRNDKIIVAGMLGTTTGGIEVDPIGLSQPVWDQWLSLNTALPISPEFFSLGIGDRGRITVRDLDANFKKMNGNLTRYDNPWRKEP